MLLEDKGGYAQTLERSAMTHQLNINTGKELETPVVVENTKLYIQQTLVCINIDKIETKHKLIFIHNNMQS